MAWTHPDGTTHWYEVVAAPAGIDWPAAHRAAAERGGYLATLTSQAENDFVFGLVDRPDVWRQDGATRQRLGPWIGGVQPAGSAEPDGSWSWAELEPFAVAPWGPGQPDDDGGADRIHYGGAAGGRAATWADSHASVPMPGYVIEYAGAHHRRTVGLLRREPRSFDGYTLISPIRGTDTFLVDPRGRIVHSWTSRYTAGVAAYLLPNGNLLRAGLLRPTTFTSGAGGIVEEFDWSGRLVWQFQHVGPTYTQHHDVERLPNGNTLMLVWEGKTRADAIAAGRNGSLLSDGLWPERVIEVDPTGKIVWAWAVWDHLIQDYDPLMANYGPVERHPERIDINFAPDIGNDWLHANAVAYNAELDQIMISVRALNEIWIIDHSTTIEQARGRSGGRSGKGGDLLYRWGNPLAYRAGRAADQQLYAQHDARWIERGLPGAGNILIFNNGNGRPGGGASTVDEIVPPVPDTRGNYARTGAAWGPDAPIWTHPRVPSKDFYAGFVSGAQRLQNGNTLICDGPRGRAFEVTRDGSVVWEYKNPISSVIARPARQGDAADGNLVFRAPRYAPDHPGLRGRNLQPAGPAERYEVAILADGAGAPHQAALGSTVSLSLIAVRDPGQPYVVGTSLTPGVLEVDYRHFRVGFDAILLSSMLGRLPGVFVNYAGVLDSSGRANAKIVVPRVPGLVGLSLHTAFLVVDPPARSGIATMSCAVIVRVEG